MNCESARYHIQEALDGCCENRAELLLHLETCPACRQYEQQLQALDRAFQEDIKVPVDLVQRVVPKRRPWIPVALAVAGLAVIFFNAMPPTQDASDIETALSWLGPDIEELE